MVINLEDVDGADIPVKINENPTKALVDTGAYMSCISEASYYECGSPPLDSLCNLSVRSASGTDLLPLGMACCLVRLGDQEYQHKFIVCKKLTKRVILGIDFLRTNRIDMCWTNDGRFQLKKHKQVLVQAIETEHTFKARTSSDVTLPAGTVSVIEVESHIPETKGTTLYDFKPTERFEKTGIHVAIIPIVYSTKKGGMQKQIQVLANFELEPVKINKGTVLGTFENLSETIGMVDTPTSFEGICEITTGDDQDPFLQEILRDASEERSKFIVSPADIETHREVKLEDADVPNDFKERFDQVCQEYDDVFSKSSSDLGRTELLTMEIDTGDHPPITQRPYNLALRHVDWVQEELFNLEKAGVITKSVSPWASPIVIVPKKTAPGEPPRRRMCVDYRMVNSLAPPVVKAHSKAKGVLSFVPIPKIDEIYAKLKDSHIYSTFDMRSGYYHLGLSTEAQAKTAFVLGGPKGGKWEFKVCPFGLSQAPAYFQRLINQVIEGLPFAFAYLDDILIFSKDVEEHMEHVKILLQRLREAHLKINARKCNFLKKHVQYLGHLISGDGIMPVPEKLDSLKKMTPPTTVKGVRQFLGFTGYYRKFIPRFSDIARPLTNLTKQDTDFVWTKECQKHFELLKEFLLKEPVLKYPDPNKPYIMYTDASKYGWAGVLTQEYEYDEDGKIKKIHHPITYLSGLFRGPQLNWAALTKEAYAIYMSVKKLAYYITDAQITLRTDHLPLKKFLEKNTLNSKVNNWAVEISPFRIKLEYIKGIKNTLADTMSRLLDINDSIAPEQEGDDQEFGECVFEQLDPILVNVIQNPKAVKPTEEDNVATDECQWDITPEQLVKLQSQDSFCLRVLNKMQKEKENNSHPYYIEEGVLKKYVVDNKQRFETIVVPKGCVNILLKLAHDELGHNGSARTYMMLKRHYYWKGMKPQVYKYVKRCKTCQKFNVHIVKYQKGHFEIPEAPMDFISMDLIGNFIPSSSGNRYALTVICMLTGFVWCIPIPDKKAETVVNAYLERVYYWWGGSRKILSDNGTEFKNALFTEVAKTLGVEHKIYSPPYHPQSNGRIEGFHLFLKSCMAKHISTNKEWDEVIPLACAAYNFMPNEHSRESPFFLMYGRDARIPLTQMFQPKVRYLGTDETILSLEALKNIYFTVAQNLKLAREKLKITPQNPAKQVKPNDMVLIKVHETKPFEPRYKGDFRVVSLKGNQVEVTPTEGGPTRWVHIRDVKYILPAEAIIGKIPDFTNVGRTAKLNMHPNMVPDLQWSLTTKLSSIVQNSSPTIANSSANCTTVNTTSIKSSCLPI